MILVTTDLSEHSKFAFPVARDEAIARNETITLLSVLEGVVVPVSLYELALPPDVAELDRTLAEKTRNELNEIAKSAFPGIKVTVEVIISKISPAAEVICTYARDHKAFRIVIASQGKGALKQIFVGSVVSRVLAHAQMPVLVVPSHAA